MHVRREADEGDSDRPARITAWLGLATEDGIPEGSVRVFMAAGRRVAVARVQGRLFAVEGECTCDRGCAESRVVRGHTVECHPIGCRFDLRDGSVLRSPATQPLRTYPVNVVHGHLEVELPESEN